MLLAMKVSCYLCHLIGIGRQEGGKESTLI